MRFINFAMVRFSLCLIIGIFCARYFKNLPYTQLLLICFVLLFVFWLISRKQIFQQVYFGIFAHFTFILFGSANYQLRTPEYQPDHYSHKISSEKHFISLKIIDELKPDSFNKKYIANIDYLDSDKSNGKILLLINNYSEVEIEVDDRLKVFGAIKFIDKPLNPYQFDYAQYMANLNVYGQLRLDRGELISQQRGKPSLSGFAHKLRNRIIQNLKELPINDKERSIMQALVLGQRNEIPTELYESYTAAGAVHMLAVSGLHVGIIYLFINFLLGRFLSSWQLKRLRLSLLVLLLWLFALFTGGSASVVRAVTMFSFFALAQALNRPTNPINTLFLSLFFLLLINPKWLFLVGFQLSYSAVFFILWLQPKLASYYTPRTYFDKLIWSIITVSLAAQLGVAPLSIYYFHSFPGLFLISNIVILPFLGLLIGMGIIVIVWIMITPIPEEIVFVYNLLLKLINQFVNWVGQQDAFIFRDIHFTEFHLIGSYILLIALVTFWRQSNTEKLIILLCSFSIFLGLLVLNSKLASKQQLVLFHKNRQSLLAIQNGNKMKLLINDTTKDYLNDKIVKNFSVNRKIELSEKDIFPDILAFKNKLILVVDSTAVYPNQKVDVVVLRSSPKVNLDRLIDCVRPSTIVADGSNYKTYIARWKQSCLRKKLPFHYTSERGAFILE